MLEVEVLIDLAPETPRSRSGALVVLPVGNLGDVLTVVGVGVPVTFVLRSSVVLGLGGVLVSHLLKLTASS